MMVNSIKLLCLAALAAVMSIESQAQTIVRIGEAELVIQTPLSIKKTDTLETSESFYQSANRPKYRPRSYSNLYLGFGMAVPLDRSRYLPVHYGESYNFEVGVKKFYRPARSYAIGTMVSYSFYNYRLKNSPLKDIFGVDAAGREREYFRTDNVEFGVINRLYIQSRGSRRITLDLGAYGDLGFSRRYKIKTVSDAEGKSKDKFRDGSIFNPIQAGLYGALTLGRSSVYAKYRFTNHFNPEVIPNEVPRLSIGVHYEL